MVNVMQVVAKVIADSRFKTKDVQSLSKKLNLSWAKHIKWVSHIILKWLLHHFQVSFRHNSSSRATDSSKLMNIAPGNMDLWYLTILLMIKQIP